MPTLHVILAPQALHHLGIPTTRALCLIVSQTETVQRPWYKTDDSQNALSDDTLWTNIIKMNPELASADDTMKKTVLRYVRGQDRDPSRMIEEKCAISTRVAPSFLRVGHIELHGRRARKDAAAIPMLEQLIRHALMREFAATDDPTAPLQCIMLSYSSAFCVYHGSMC